MNIIKTKIFIKTLIVISLVQAGSETNFSAGNSRFLADLYKDSWAVIIGINDYKHMPKLNYAVNDAVAIKEMLMSKYNFKEDHIKLILNEEATKDNITQGFHQLLQKAKEKDRVVIFYAGHGETYTLPSGGEMGYLIPVDGNPEELYLTSIPMSELYEIAQMSYAKHILYLVDACYSGLAITSNRGISRSTPSYFKKITSEKGRQIITAGSKDELVIERSEWGHSAFTKNILTGLGKGSADIDGDGIVTANELGEFLTERVHDETAGAHTPQIGRIGTEMGELIFIYIPDQSSNDVPYKQYKEESRTRYNLYRSAKKNSWFYPGLSHLKLGQKKKGLFLAAAETVSLGLMALSWNNYNISYNKYLDSKKIYDIAGSAGYQNVDVEFAKQQYLSDHETYQLSTVQFGVSLFASVAIWVYNIYDINKLRYLYTGEINHINYNVNLSPSGELKIQFRF
mgnify:CR=1 FL=1